MERIVLRWIWQSAAQRVWITNTAFEELDVLLGGRFGSVADGGLFGNSGLEDAAKVGDSQENDHQQGEDEAELYERLTPR